MTKDSKESWLDQLIYFLYNHPKKSFLGLVLVGVFIHVIIQLFFDFGDRLHFTIFTNITPGEVLSYWGSIFFFLGTIILGALAFKQNKELTKLENNNLFIQNLIAEEYFPFFVLSKATYQMNLGYHIVYEMGKGDDHHFVISFKNNSKSRIRNLTIISELTTNYFPEAHNDLEQQITINNIILPNDEIIVNFELKLDDQIYENYFFGLNIILDITTISGCTLKENIVYTIANSVNYGISPIYSISSEIHQTQFLPLSVGVHIPPKKVKADLKK